MIDTIIFDLDGTLLNTLEDLTYSVNHALLQYDLTPRTLDEVKEFTGNGVAKLVENCLPDGRNNPHFDDVYVHFKEHYEIHCKDMTKPYDGILPLLDELCVKGYKLGIVSNKFDSAVKELSKQFFGDRIISAVGESETIRKKPAPDTANQVLKELSSLKENAIYVGDTDVDIATAANVPMHCISVTWGFRTRERLLEAGANPAFMIGSPQELLPLIQILSREE